MSPQTRDESASVASTPQSVDGQRNGARSRSSTPSTHVGNSNSNQDRAESKQREAASDNVAQPPAKRMKRGKYISRACTSCQRRKIKCEGGNPCVQCIARNRPCVSAPRGEGGGANGQHAKDGMASTDRDAASSAQDASGFALHREILERLAGVERRLSTMQPPPSLHDPVFHASHRDRRYSSYGARSVDDHDDSHSPKSAVELDKVLEPDGQTFAGELSINGAFDGMAASVLDAEGEASCGAGAGGANGSGARSSTSPANSSSNKHNEDKGDAPGDGGETRDVRGWLESTMASHGIVVDEDEWRQSLRLYLDDVYVLYPILHPPTLWAIFDSMWEWDKAALWDMSSAGEREQKRLSVALVCFCLALSRCSLPKRRNDAHGVHSAGWSLYRVGVSLMQDITGLSNTASKSLLTLQLLLLRVLYLFRLDATQGAARVLAIAVANGHIMGLHRQSTLDSMPVFSSQMYCRVWWCLYVLDRRIALESGQPFLIQDANIDTALPIEISDEWLSRHAKASATTAEMAADIAAELARKPVTSITYLQVRIRCSRIISRAWEVLYGIQPATASSPAMVECMDAMLCRLLAKMPPMLAYDPYVPLETQFRDRPRWLAMQAVVLYTCCTFLRLLIQTLLLSSPRPPGRTEDDELQSITTCASLAASILEGNNSLSDTNLKYSFPISHYLTSATMVMATLVSKEPSLKTKYAHSIRTAMQCLDVYCNKTWVSGKMKQWVSRLGVLVKRTLADNSPTASLPSASDARSSLAYSQHGHAAQQHAFGFDEHRPFLTDADAHSDTTQQTASSSSSSISSSSSSSSKATSASSVRTRGEGISGTSDASSSVAASWTGGSGSGSDTFSNEMSSWLTMPSFDFGTAMAGTTDLYPGPDPANVITMSEDLLGNVRSDGGLGFGRDLQGFFGPFGRTGFFGIELDVDLGGMDQAMGNLDCPVLGL